MVKQRGSTPLSLMRNRKLGDILRKYQIMIGVGVVCLVFSLITPNFLSGRNIINILRQSSYIGLMAIGTTFVIIGGDFDISIGSTLALCGALVIMLQNNAALSWPVAVILVIFIGGVIGFINGFFTAKIKIVGIITTLATMAVLRGVTYIITGKKAQIGQSESFRILGTGYTPILIFIVMVLIMQFLLKKTKIGRYSCAVGGNKEAARLSGIPVDFYKILTFVIGGCMAAMGAIVFAARINSVSPLAGAGYELDAIAATVIGGTSVSGGEGSVIGTFIGILLLIIISNMFNLLGVSVDFQLIIKGLIILTVVGFDSYTRFKAE